MKELIHLEAKGHREERLAALLVLRQFAGWKFAEVIDLGGYFLDMALEEQDRCICQLV